MNRLSSLCIKTVRSTHRALAVSLLLTACSPAPKNSADATIIADQIAQDSALALQSVEALATYTLDLYTRKAEILPSVDKSRYTTAPDGAFYKPVNDGGAALWISGAVPITEPVQEVAYLTEPMDAELKRICKETPSVVQAYYNDRNSLNRIYPWMDVLTQYEPKMDIPKFNFYYLADAEHNPSRKGVWVDEPYVDPAGRGWMISAIAPVYSGTELLGVVGLDVTLDTISERYMEHSKKPVAVFARTGVLVAATEDAIAIMEMPRIKEHRYLETVKKDTYKADDYNVTKSPNRAIRQISERLTTAHSQSPLSLDLASGKYHASTSIVPGINFTVVVFEKL